MNFFKTCLLLVLMAMLLVWIGGLIGGARGAMYAFIFALILNGASYWFSDSIVLKMYGAREISREKNAVIYSMVEELCARGSIPLPKICMVNMDVPNAFATGRDPEHAALCLSRGLLSSLDEEEIRGVVSHELAHIKHRDTLIMTVTAALASAIMMIAYMARWAAIFGGFSRDSRDGDNLFGLIAISILGPLAALLVQMAISRSREFAADAGGAKLTGRPEGLARALEDISAASKRMPFNAPPQTAHLFIVKPFSRTFISNLFSTHPPVEERVKRLRSMA